MWILEDEGPESLIGIPSASAALDALIRAPHPDTHDRIVRTASNKAQSVAKLALLRLRNSIKDHSRMHESRTVIYMDLIIHLCRPAKHPLRHAFLHGGMITLATNIAVTVSRLLNSGGHPGLIAVMVDAFCILANCLESTDGFTWVLQSIKAGLLGAWVDCSPFFARLDSEDREMVTAIFSKIVPKYLVYRSVIQAVDNSMQSLKLDEEPHRGRVSRSIVSDVWFAFHKLALERMLVSSFAKAMKGKDATCDNVQCQRVDDKDNFKRCAACQSTLYCSKECQTIAWRQGGHKDMCVMKQQERLEGKLQAISKGDSAFFHKLAPRDARRALPTFRRMAKQQFPDTDKSGLVACIDYTKLPPEYSLLPLADYDTKGPAVRGSPNAEARREALIERAKDNPNKITLIQSKIANGQGLQLVLTIVPGSFWDDSEEWDFDPEEEDDEYGDAVRHRMDAVDISMARMALDGILKSRGEPPAH
ncbi:hypothetical protein CC2G_012530 [Coprinopsis cinerea AmutBmut pab1-1]|nr:hypothetical protein CC2G_012530 [Coprinopsis cinerea AmutBmut pab1-1]